MEYSYIDCQIERNKLVQFTDSENLFLITKENFDKGIEIMAARGMTTAGSFGYLFKTFGIKVSYYIVREHYFPSYINKVTSFKFCTLLNRAKELKNNLSGPYNINLTEEVDGVLLQVEL